MQTLSDRSLHIEVESTAVPQPAESVQLSLGSNTYLLRLEPTQEGEVFVTDIVTPSAGYSYPLTLIVLSSDGSSASFVYALEVIPDGYTYEVKENEKLRVGLSEVTLVGSNDVVWDGSPYAQFNPITTGENGSFAWYVPNGSYRVVAQRDGYDRVETPRLNVTRGIVGPLVEMYPVLEEELVIPVVTETIERATEFAAGVKATFVPIREAVQIGLKTIREVPGVQTTAQVSVPALAVTAGASVVVLTVAFDFLPFLQYFLGPSPVLGAVNVRIRWSIMP